MIIDRYYNWNNEKQRHGSLAGKTSKIDCIGKTKRGKGSKIMAVVTRKSRPLALKVFSATPFETTLVEQTIKERFARAKIGSLVTGPMTAILWIKSSEQKALS